MTISREELIKRCEWVSGRVEKELVATGDFTPTFYFGKGPGPTLYTLPLVVLSGMLDSGNQKMFLFSTIRLCVETHGYDCVIFSSDIWGFESNEKGSRLKREQFEKLIDRGFKKLVKKGYGTVSERLAVVGQTPDDSLVVYRPYVRYPSGPDEGRIQCLGDAVRPDGKDLKFGGGRMTMFGDWNDEDTKNVYTKLKERIDTIPPMQVAIEAFPVTLKAVYMETNPCVRQPVN